jgi:hypothetical protein
MTYLRAILALAIVACYSSAASAQVTPAAGYTPPDDTPSIRVGVVLYPDYTYTLDPESTDADGNQINFSQFNVSRAYINVTGNISHLIAFRITPDVTRADTTSGATLNGSLVYRIKYAYAQFNLDDWMTRGSYARFGIQQTPWLDFAEGIYRYRFQGTMFVEREGYFASADGGASFHYQLPANYGDIHTGVFNGENYNRSEANDQKAFMIRGTVRPLPAGAPILRGVRASVFWDGDHYVKNADRNRFIFGLNFEHKYVNAAYEYLDVADQTSITRPEVDGKGYSIWFTPKSTIGWEALIRYDHLKPNETFGNQVRNRTIVGVAYWFPHQGNVQTTLMLDYDGQTFDNFSPAISKQARLAVHGQVVF